MKRTVTDCDSCGKENVKTETVSFFSHISSGGPGPSEREYDNLDFCLVCCARLLGKMIDGFPDEEQARLKEKWTKK